jgi:hypothetical protein
MGRQARRKAEAGTLHPWAHISELFSPFMAGWRKSLDEPAVRGLTCILLAGLPAGVVLLWRRRWGPAALLAAFCAAGLSARRNIALPAILGALLIASAGQEVLAWWNGRSRQEQPGQGRRPARMPPAMMIGQAAVMLAVAGACLFWTGRVVTNRFYLAEGAAWRFGGGVSRTTLPVGVSEWLEANLPARQPAFVDPVTSSSIVFLGTKVTASPCSTNTWDIPPDRLADVRKVMEGHLPPETLNDWGLDLVVLRLSISWRPLARSLLAAADWALVYAEGPYLVFVRRTDANAELIIRQQITRESFQPARFIEATRKLDLCPAAALADGADMLQILGWREHAERVWRACLAELTGRELPQAWINLGICLADRGQERCSQGHPDGMTDLREARDCFQAALRIETSNSSARKAVQTVEEDIHRFRQSLEQRP